MKLEMAAAALCDRMFDALDEAGDGGHLDIGGGRAYLQVICGHNDLGQLDARWAELLAARFARRPAIRAYAAACAW